MKYNGSIEINKPIELVAKLFADPKNLGEYQDGFVKKDLISGEQGKEGTVSQMFYKYGNKDMVLTEIIISNNLPDTFEAHYHHKHMETL